MKHNHNHDNARSPGLELVPVRFEFAGRRNSVLRVAGSPEAVHLADAEQLPLKIATKQETGKI
jgi:hypothetical protein